MGQFMHTNCWKSQFYQILLKIYAEPENVTQNLAQGFNLQKN